MLSLEQWGNGLLGHIEMTTGPVTFCDRLNLGLRAVSDGSVRHIAQGAFG